MCLFVYVFLLVQVCVDMVSGFAWSIGSLCTCVYVFELDFVCVRLGEVGGWLSEILFKSVGLCF